MGPVCSSTHWLWPSGATCKQSRSAPTQTQPRLPSLIQPQTDRQVPEVPHPATGMVLAACPTWQRKLGSRAPPCCTKHFAHPSGQVLFMCLRLYSSKSASRIYISMRSAVRWWRGATTSGGFDFFTMLHIVDYGERENFSPPLLVAASGFAVFSALSGLVLWSLRLPRLFRRRKS